MVLSEFHASPVVGHSGFTKTYEWFKRFFFFCFFFFGGGGGGDDKKQDIQAFVVGCDTCQCNKGETVKA
jgi:hypothetical protein